MFLHPCLGRPLARGSISSVWYFEDIPDMNRFNSDRHTTPLYHMSIDVLMALSPFTRGGDSRDVRTNGSPEGHRLASHTQPLKIGGFCDFQLHPPHIGGGLGGGGCFFASFFAPKKVRSKMFLCFFLRAEESKE